MTSRRQRVSAPAAYRGGPEEQWTPADIQWAGVPAAEPLHKRKYDVKPGGFMDQVLQALDMPAARLATRLNTTKGAVIALIEADSRDEYDFVENPAWSELARYVNERLGALMAVREELQRKAVLDVDRRMRQRERMANR